jgi:hypothetical protein
MLAFADFGSKVRGARTRKGIAARKAAGLRFLRVAPWGYAWKRQGRKMIMVSVKDEQVIMNKAAELYNKGYSVDQIRQYLVYECRVTNRKGGELGHSQVHNIVRRGIELLRSASSSTKPNLALLTDPDPVHLGR